MRFKPLSMTEIGKKANMPINKVHAFLNLVKYSMKPFSKNIGVIENGKTHFYTVERRGLGSLMTKYGKFWQYSFFINNQWKKYSVIVKAKLDNNLLVPIFKNKNQLVLRIDSGCETGQVFGDLTCECYDQLQLALKTIEEIGEGMIINIPSQDGRGMGLTFKLATLWLQDVFGINTVDSASLLTSGDIIDIRTYSGIVCILKFFGISKTCHIKLATNNPDKTKALTENSYKIKKYIPMVIQSNHYTKIHLEAKQNYLGHIKLIKKEKNDNK